MHECRSETDISLTVGGIKEFVELPVNFRNLISKINNVLIRQGQYVRPPARPDSEFNTVPLVERIFRKECRACFFLPDIVDCELILCAIGNRIARILTLEII